MNPTRPDKHDDVLCYCSGTTVSELKNLIENGADTLDRLSRITGACSGCGACDSDLMNLLESCRSPAATL